MPVWALLQLVIYFVSVWDVGTSLAISGGSQRTMWRSWVSPSTMWVPGSKLRPTGVSRLSSMLPEATRVLQIKSFCKVSPCNSVWFVNGSYNWGGSSTSLAGKVSGQRGALIPWRLPRLSDGSTSCWQPVLGGQTHTHTHTHN